ncbi:class I adenylate-forming enzyme family protein [Catenuloplanes japonicus]|uniref:class I adenylate-forming enzyme family protein n=1 Tax=Catenuloplanes japonicus TaxID=33876 RepID=UPI0005275BF2|nr:fatty acid--CoA ligase family protein [Catenuloplanes japonicus]
MADRPYPQVVLDLLRAAGDRVVFEDGERHTTGAEMLALVGRIGGGLTRAGIGPGDGLALAVGVTAEAFAAIVAAHVAGTRVTGIRPGLPASHLAHLLKNGDAAVIADPARAAELSDADRLLLLPDLLGGPPETPVPVARPGDIARVIHTSGSTGLPKGCLQTYAALGAGWAPHPERWPHAIRSLAPRLQRHLLFGTLSSQVMIEYGVMALAAGGTLVAARPDLPGAIIRHRATSTVITVAKLRALVAAARADGSGPESLRALMVSGSPLDPALLSAAIDVLGPVVFHGYGQTETGMITMTAPEEMTTPGVRASVGRPPSVTTISIRGADGAECPAGAIGEVFVRTPAQACGYLDDPEESAAVFTDGWVRTRDLGFLDPDGYLHLAGRTRDVIIVNANVQYAVPIARVLSAHPSVAEAQVVGVPSVETGEAVHAFVVPADGPPDLDLLRALVRAELGEAAVPARITVIGEMPLTAAGKPDRAALLSAL